MKVQLSEHHHGSNEDAPQQRAAVNFKRTLTLAPATILLAVIPLCLILASLPVQPRDYPVVQPMGDQNSIPEDTDVATTWPVLGEKKCDVFRGKWAYCPDAPMYNMNETCHAISDEQNCMKFGRPDAEFLKWRWELDGCELPRLDAAEFMEKE